jgi:integrase
VVRWRTPDRKQHKKVHDRLIDAKQHLASITTKLADGTYIDASLGRQSFDSFAEEWAAAQDTWKAGTREAWPYIRARLKPRIGSAPLASIDQLALKKLRGELAQEYSPATVKLTMAYAGMILRAAHASRRIGHDPTVGLKHKRSRADEKNDKVRPEDVPTRAEALGILAAAPDRFRAAIALGLAGLRVGEVLGLSADRVDLASRRVTVDRQMQHVGNRNVLTTPKAEKTRTISVPALVAVELRRHLRDHQSEGILFRGIRAGDMLRRDEFYTQAWRPALKSAGLEGRFKFHACRRWCASTLLAEGAPITAVAGHLGDTVETVSRTYAHWLRDDREVPAEVLDRVLAPGRTEGATGSAQV